MIAVPLGRLAAVAGAAAVGPDGDLATPEELRASVSGIVADSRVVRPGDLFVALVGQRTDGAAFIAAAAAAGAVAAVTARPVSGVVCLAVPDAVAALGRLAREVVDRAKASAGLRVVAITGSAGKTSTKDLLAAVLEEVAPTVAPPGSLNNEIGVPLTAVRVEDATRFLVSEMGARGEGHIAYLCSITPPDVSVVLNVGSAHLGEFGSREGIARAKGEIVEALSADGTAVLNADDPLVWGMTRRTPARVLSYSPAGAPGADVRATDVHLDEGGRPSFLLHGSPREGDSSSARVRLPLVGEHQVANAVAAAAAALAVGLDLAQVAAALSRATIRSRWRMEVTERPDGVLVVNDAYNANPESMGAALRALVRLGQARSAAHPQARTWAVLGEMLELGPESATQHAELGRLAAHLGVARLVSVGEHATAVHEGARSAGRSAEQSVVVPDTAAAVGYLSEQLRPGDVVLVKASRGAALERVAEALLPKLAAQDRQP